MTTLAGFRADEASGGAVGPDGGLVHLVRRRPGPAVDDEVAALVAGAGPHVPRLLDVATVANGDVVLVLEHLPHRLATLLQVPGWPTAGEAVTVLVPLAQTVAALGSAGVRHGAVGPNAVRFDDAGRPVLARFGGAAPLVPGQQAGDDEQALRLLAETLLERCGALDLARCIAIDRPHPAALAELLFESAEPRPVRLDPAPTVAALPPARLVAVPAPTTAAPAPSFGAAAVAARSRLRDGAAGVGVRLRAVRRRVWIAAAASVALLVAALVLLPSHADRSAAAASDPPAAGHAAPSASAGAPGRTAAGPPPARRAATADPLTAVAALLSERAGCLAAARTACLTAVEAPDSPLLADDLAAIRSGTDAAPDPQGTPRLIQRAGTTALVAIGGTTALVVRQPDGWRLRDLVAGG